MNEQGKRLTYSALMCALMVISTLWFKFTMPGTDMLVTTQVFFVLLCGQLLPPRWCLMAMGLYLLLGLCGLPVFSAVSGPGVLVTPSFGYLLGFPCAAACAAIVRGKLRGRWGRYAASFVGLAALYAVALVYIACLKRLYLGVTMGAGAFLTAYCFAFLPLDAAKAALAAALGQRLEKALRLTSAAPAKSAGASGESRRRSAP